MTLLGELALDKRLWQKRGFSYPILPSSILKQGPHYSSGFSNSTRNSFSKSQSHFWAWGSLPKVTGSGFWTATFNRKLVMEQSVLLEIGLVKSVVFGTFF